MEGCKPKTYIAAWGQLIQDKAAQCRCLVNPYDAYDQVLNYWNDTMQDDLFLIADSGWVAKAEAPLVVDKKANTGHDDGEPVVMKSKDKFTYRELATDLLPVDIVVREYFQKELNAIELREASREQELNLQSALVEKYEEDFDESYFENQKFSKANLKKALTEAKRERKEFMRDIIPHWEQWLKLEESAAAIKREISKLEKDLTDKVTKRYDTLTVEEVKHLVIDKKWGEAIFALCDQQMQDCLQQEVTNIISMHERYEFTLPELEQTLDDDRAKVKSYLQQMGYAL